MSTPPESPNKASAEVTPTEREASLMMGALQGLTSVKSKDSSIRRPTHVKRGDRKVSWDQTNSSGGLLPRTDLPDLVNTRSRSHSQDTGDGMSLISGDKISVKDVQQTQPVEDAADAYIMKALDQTDPTRDGVSEAQKTILGLVPQNSKHQFRTDEEEERLKETKGKHRHRRVPTTSETLANLAMEMQTLHKVRTSFKSEGQDIEIGGTHSSDTESFVNNAATIMLRNRSKRNAEAAKAEEARAAQAAEAATGNPAARWKNLRNSVLVANALNNSNTNKKDDEVAENIHTSGSVDSSTQGSNESMKNSKRASTSTRKKKKKGHSRTRQELESDMRDFELWLSLRKANFFSYVRNLVCFWILPIIGIAAILFYLGGNPPCGTQRECVERQRFNELSQQLAAMTGQDSEMNMTENSGIEKLNFFRQGDLSEQASASWWLLFLGVRQVVTYSLAQAAQAFFIDFIALRTRLFVRILGPLLTLMVVQSRGWPFVLAWWSIFNFGMTYGKNSFARHWLFFQDAIDLFNDKNPSGGVTSSRIYLTVLALGTTVGFLATAKRVYIGIILGKQTYGRFATDLATVMRKCLLVGQVAGLALDIEKYEFTTQDLRFDHSEVYDKTLHENNSEAVLVKSASKRSGGLGDQKSSAVLDSSNDQRSRLAGADITGSVRIKIDELLGAWEEPESASQDEKVPISSLIQFRQSLSYLNATFPFGVSFGQANTREHMVENTELVYQRLLSADPDKVILNFDTLALLAINPDGDLDINKLKELVCLFRPQRDGSLSLLDFAKSVDSVYKDLRLLRASVANSTKLDRAFEKLVNILYYFIIGCLVLSILGIDPLVLFASISGFVLGFAFMIGSAASKYFEGLLLIFVRRPYNIGDRINISDINRDTEQGGSAPWMVKDIDLFTTTVIYGPSNEEATLNNGAIASSKIINFARSKNANLWFLIKFPIDTPYSKIKVFRTALDSFVKDRPREWVAMLAFRNTVVAVDQGYVEYIAFLQHRESWQNIGACLDSKAELAVFALEVSKRMGLRYHSPPMPVDLNVKPGSSLPTLREGPRMVDEETGSQSSYSVDFGAVAAMFNQDSNSK